MRGVAVCTCLLALVAISLAQRATPGCRYEKQPSEMGECVEGKQTVTARLLRGPTDQCQATQTRERRCQEGAAGPAARGGRKSGRGRDCRYSKPTVGDCGEDNTQTITRNLLPSSTGTDCEPQQITTRQCSGAGGRRGGAAVGGRRQANRKAAKQARKVERKEDRKEARQQNRAQDCQYARGEKGACVDGRTTRVDTLIPGSGADCEASRTMTLPCREGAGP